MPKNKLSLFMVLLRKYFFRRLDRKTGWGNQEVRLELEQAINEALAQMIEGLEEDNHDHHIP